MSCLMRTDDHSTLKGLFNQYGYENILSFLVARASASEEYHKENGDLNMEVRFRTLKNLISDCSEDVKSMEIDSYRT